MTNLSLIKDVPEFPLLWHQQLAIDTFRDKGKRKILVPDGVVFVGDNCMGMFIPTGLGKTRTVLTTLGLENVQRTIIVTKKNILYKIAAEVEKWTNYSCQVISSKNKRDDLTSQIVIVNYDMIQSLKEKLIRYGAEAIVLDESHCIKNPSAVRTKCAFNIRDGIMYKIQGSRKVPIAVGKPIKFRFDLTGTSLAKGFEDWFTQYKFLNDKIMPKFITAYRSMYCPTAMVPRGGGGRYPKLMGYTNITGSTHQGIPALMDRVRPYTFSVKKEDCLDLPPKMPDVIPLAMTDEQRNFYKKMQAESVVETQDWIALARIYIAKIGKLHQIANGFLISSEGKYERLPGPYPKMEWLKEWLSEIIEDDKVILWTNFVVTGEMVRETLQEMGVNFAYIKRGMTPEEVAEQNTRFQNDKSVRVMTSAIKVGNSGIDLFAGNWSVFIDCDEAYLDRAQAEDRTYRYGQKKTCHYIDVVMKNTVERGILANLKGKRSLHDLSVEELAAFVKEED